MAPRFSVKCRPAHRVHPAWLSLSLMYAALPALALEALDEPALSSVTAQDGLTVELTTATGVTTQSVNWITDKGVANRAATTILAPGLLDDTSVAGAPRIRAQLDVGSTASGSPLVAIQLDWNEMLLKIGRLSVDTAIDYKEGNSIGMMGLYSKGHLTMTNTNGLFNSAGSSAMVDFATSGDLFYRANSGTQPELSFGNLTFSNKFSNGTIGIDGQGLIIMAPLANSQFEFDVMYKGAATTEFERSGRRDIIHLGWTGDLINPLLRVSGGGYDYGTGRSEGLNMLAQWDFASNFGWIIGQAGGNKTVARLYDWRRMNGLAAGTPMLSMPITLDVLQNGVGPSGLCFGGGFASGTPSNAACATAINTSIGDAWVASSVPANKAAMAVMIRDGHLHGYNQKIKIGSRSAVEDSGSAPVYNWSLLYTFGKLDSDIFFYPEGRLQGVSPASTAPNGIKADIALMSQSPGFWDNSHCLTSTSPTTCTAGAGATTAKAALVRASAGNSWVTNTHFMLADTAVGGDSSKQIGVGLINADLLWQANDMYFRVVNTDSGYPQIPGGVWMQTDTRAVYQFRGLFGGADLLDMSPSKVSGISLMNIRLATNRFIFALHPDTSGAADAHVGFTGLLDLVGGAGGSELSLAEPSSPTTSHRFHDMSGRIAWRNGSIGLVTSSGTPELVLKNDLSFGSSGTFGNAADVGNPLLARIAYGNEDFGRIALPAGNWSSEVRIKIPAN